MKHLSSVLSYLLTHRLKAIGIIGLVVIGLIIVAQGTKPVVQHTNQKPIVEVASGLTYAGTQDFSTVGSVRAFTEAVITSESSGRVVTVNALLGQSVPAGYVLATLENASEQAAVLQAEGVYEAALAAAAQSNIGVSEASTLLTSAKSGAVSAVIASYNTVNGIVRNNIDNFFSNPESKVPGLKIDGQGITAQLNSERVAYQTILSDWQAETNTLTADSNLEASFDNAEAQIDRTIRFVDSFISLFNAENADSSYTSAELQAFSVEFTNLRGALLASKNALSAASANLASAYDTVERANISATGGIKSSADAQVKQALGALRSAQANLSKTVFRTPISGTVNSLSVRTGDFVSPQMVVARIANNSALEIVAYLGEKERDVFAVGDKVMVENKFEGTVTEIAPAVDPATGKIEIRIATESEEIKNGDTVTVGKVIENAVSSTFFVPLSAVKFQAENGYVLTVSEGKLVSKPVTLGVVRGGSIEIKDGLKADEMFVVDARGLNEGTEVDVAL